MFPGTSALEQSALKRERDLTVRQININTQLLKCYNDYLDRQSSGSGRGRATYFKVEDIFSYALDQGLQETSSRFVNANDRSWCFSAQFGFG